MKKINLFLIVFLLTGCANFLTTTGTKGISFGMSKEKVLKKVDKKGWTVISEDENTIVVDGMQEQLKQPAIKIFNFNNGRLDWVEDKIK